MPHIGRFLLIATFIEDGFRLWFSWRDQVDFFDRTWGQGSSIAVVFVFANLMLQLVGSALIMLRFRVVLGCLALFGVVLLQV
jgi:ER-derived vesicles protein